MYTEEEEASKLSNPSFQVEDDDDSVNVTTETTVVDSGKVLGQNTDRKCEPEFVVELSEPEPPQRQPVAGEEGGEDSIGGEPEAVDELAESRVDDGGAESRDSLSSASPVIVAEDSSLVTGEGGVGDVIMEGGDSLVPAPMVVGGGNDEEDIGKEEGQDVVTEFERELADAVMETEEKAEAAEDTGEKAYDVEEMEKKGDAVNEMEGKAYTVDKIEEKVDEVEEMEENADAVEEIEENADEGEETEKRADIGEETREMAEVGDETKAIAEEINVIDAKEETEIAEEIEAADLTKDTVVADVAADETELNDVEERMELQEEDTGETELEDDLLEKEMEEADEAEMRDETDVEMETGDVPDETEEAEADTADEMEKVDVAEETEEAEADMAVEMGKADGAEDMVIGKEVELSKVAGGKRKRGGKNSKSPGRAPSRKKSEEDVCFICFDGGELVLCDRRGCPKAYHPACVNRDEAFFRAKGRWNCGWHLCSICEKSAFYMCYTCTFSLCKGCIKDAAILCVKGNKGFCEPCMKTVMLIERNDQGNKEMVQVDFDDKGSWEYLFKDYWLDLKGRLSLSLDDLVHAKNPWKGSDIHASKHDSPSDDYDANKDGGLDSGSSGHAEATVSKRRKAKTRSKSRAKENASQRLVAVTGAEGASTDENVEWASPELIELVMHMRNGDKSALSQFDVQTLLLDYIKKYKLRDPHRRTHVICNARLQNLFGKPRVGHFEMLKLLESHFLAKEESQVDNLQESVVDTEANQLEADGNFDALIKGGKDKKRKARKKGDGRGLQSNLNDYAAIDMHNINLIYLRRNLLEELLEDTDTFHDKVVGCFARIRISGSVQKQDLYRLVQVVGTSKVAETYKVGKRTTDIILEILNLNKTEVISIDIISNQEFTEDECKRLRQSIKCGLINRLTVGDIQEKATALQAVRVNDWMESEILRLSHLRDRASDMGHRKELRECVEKLQLLKMPVERQRRLEEIPDIHADPNMDPSYESDEDDGEAERQEKYKKPRGSAFSRRGREQISPRTASNEILSGTRNYSSGNKELSRSMSDKGMNKGGGFNGARETLNENLWNQGRDTDMQRLNNLEKPRSALNLETGARNSHSAALSESITRAASEISPTPAATGVTQSGAKINESDKIWYYKDPSGKVQGPFSMVQLRKWSNTGYFPANLRIWRSADNQDDSILLTDALAGKFHKDPPLVDAGFPKSQTVPYSGKLYGAPLQQGMEGPVGGNSNFDHNRTTLNSHSTLGSLGQSARESWKLPSETGSMGGAPPSSIEVQKHFRDRRGSETKLPSPTPTQRTVEAKEKTFEKEWSPTPVQPSGSRMIANMFSGDHGGQQPSNVVVPESGQLINSSTLSSASKFSGGVDGLNISHGVSSASKPETVESHRMQVNVHQVPATGAAAVASMNPGADLKNIAASIQNLVQHSSTRTSVETQGWGSGSVARPEMISLSPKLNSVSQTWGSAPSQKLESNNVVSMPAETHASSFSTGNPSGVFPAPGPPSDSWRPQVPGHSNVQLPIQSNLPWGTGVPANQNSMPRQGQENQNTGWGPMPGNPSMGWAGQVPVNTNMNWGAPGQGQAPGNVQPISGWAAQGPGQAPRHPNPGWVAPGQGQTPVNTISGWAPPGQAPAPLNANPGWIAPGQGPPGNVNPGWAAPSGNPGMWGSEQNNGGDRFSSQRDRASQGGGRPWNMQSSFGSRGDSSRPPFNKGQRVCKFHESGHCKKGSQCDYLHS